MLMRPVQEIRFPDLFAKPLVAQFDTPQQSSDGGAILRKAIDDRLGLTARPAGCLPECRQSVKGERDLPTLIRQRCSDLACGYRDADDTARFKDDLTRKPRVGRRSRSRDRTPAGLPADAVAVGKRHHPPDLGRVTYALADTVIARHQGRLASAEVRRIPFDLDPTDDSTYGQPECAFFNGHSGSWCYLPVSGFLAFKDNPKQQRITVVLRRAMSPRGAGDPRVPLRTPPAHVPPRHAPGVARRGVRRAIGRRDDPDGDGGGLV